MTFATQNASSDGNRAQSLIADLQKLRAQLASGAGLRQVAEGILEALPAELSVLVAFSTEGHAAGVACAVLAEDRGRELRIARASHLTPLAPPPDSGEWSWACVEEFLSLGPARPWAIEWAKARGGRYINAAEAASAAFELA